MVVAYRLYDGKTETVAFFAWIRTIKAVEDVRAVKSLPVRGIGNGKAVICYGHDYLPLRSVVADGIDYKIVYKAFQQ